LAEIGSISASPHNHTNQIHCFLGKMPDGYRNRTWNCRSRSRSKSCH
jgi:hypothetical protein